MNLNHQDIDEFLLLQYLQGNMDATLRRAVEKWLEAEAANRKVLERLEALWLETGKLDPPPLPVDMLKAWERLSSRIDQHDSGQTRLQQKYTLHRNLKIILGAAALLLLVLGINAVIRILTVKPKPFEFVATTTVLHDTLPDGTRISLNRQSKLIAAGRFDGGKRVVKLTGEAFFEVSRDSSHPFVVEAGAARVMVLGTMFGVTSYPSNNIRVTVTEGRVLFFTVDSLHHDTLSIVREAGLSCVVRHGAMKADTAVKPSPERLFWANRALDFSDTPLSEVFDIGEKNYGVKIAVSTPGIGNCRLTASFSNDPANRIMTVIAESFGLQLTVAGNNYKLTGDGCSKGSR